jgi:hypothetical protein
MKTRFALALPLALAFGACGEAPVAPKAASPERPLLQPAAAKGTGIVINSLTNLKLPVIPIGLGDVTINQAAITNFALLENGVGQIIGLQANGVLELTGGVLGTDVVRENFSTVASVTSSGPGQCTLVTIGLTQFGVNLSDVARVEVPAATETIRPSGALGSLLCNLGQALAGIGSALGGGNGAQGLVNAINNQIG